MKFAAAAAVAALLCADAALAGVASTRSQARREARMARRAARRSSPYMGHNKTTSHATVESNWGGAILEGSGFTAASATANVPAGSGGASAAGTAWVGIDGATCDTAILQTGFDWYGDGTYDAWYEWYPASSDDFSGITIAEGDSIAMSVIATSKNSGSATLENLTTGQTVTKKFTDIKDGNLCETSAEFIIEDFEECEGSSCSPVTFASFSPAVKFTDCSATEGGKTVGLSGAVMTEVEINNSDKTSCTVSGTTLTCSYV